MLKSFFPGWFVIILTGCIFLIGCENAPEPRNRFDFAAGNNFTSGNRTAVTPGEILTTSLYAETAADDNKFIKLLITCNYDNNKDLVKFPTVTYLDSTLNTSNFAMVFNIGTRGIAGIEYWTFTLQDSQGKTYTKQYQITTTKGKLDYEVYSSTFYHKSAHENIKYFSTANGLAFPGYIGRSIGFQGKSDFFFEIDNPAENTFSLRSAASSVQLPKTLFRTTTLTSDQFNSIVTVADINKAYTTTNAPEVNQIKKAKNDLIQVIAFKTAASKYGLMRLDTLQVLPALNGGTKAYRLPYSIKMEKP